MPFPWYRFPRPSAKETSAKKPIFEIHISALPSNVEKWFSRFAFSFGTTIARRWQKHCPMLAAQPDRLEVSIANLDLRKQALGGGLCADWLQA
jgi:hypothetical protein